MTATPLNNRNGRNNTEVGNNNPNTGAHVVNNINNRPGIFMSLVSAGIGAVIALTATQWDRIQSTLPSFSSQMHGYSDAAIWLQEYNGKIGAFIDQGEGTLKINDTLEVVLNGKRRRINIDHMEMYLDQNRLGERDIRITGEYQQVINGRVQEHTVHCFDDLNNTPYPQNVEVDKDNHQTKLKCTSIVDDPYHGFNILDSDRNELNNSHFVDGLNDATGN